MSTLLERPGRPDRHIVQFPFFWRWTTQQGAVLTTDTSTILFRSPTFDFWRIDAQEETDVPLARGARDAQHHIVDFLFHRISAAAVAISAGTLVVEGSARNETNDAQGDVLTIATVGTAALRDTPTTTNMLRMVALPGLRVPCRFVRFTLTLTTTTAGSPTVVYAVNISGRES